MAIVQGNLRSSIQGNILSFGGLQQRPNHQRPSILGTDLKAASLPFPVEQKEFGHLTSASRIQLKINRGPRDESFFWKEEKSYHKKQYMMDICNVECAVQSFQDTAANHIVIWAKYRNNVSITFHVRWCCEISPMKLPSTGVSLVMRSIFTQPYWLLN